VPTLGNYVVSPNERAQGSVAFPSPFDKDIELLKINIVAEELRGSFYTLFGAYFSFLIAILGAIVVVSTTVPEVATRLEWLAILPIIGIVVFLYSKNTAMRHRNHIVAVDMLIEQVESQKSIGKVRDVIDKIAKQG